MAWRRADELASLTFRTLRETPPDDRWLANQAIRAAISVAANIAEGNGRGSLGDYLRFLDIAKGSLAELEYYLHFFAKEKLIPQPRAEEMDVLRVETGRLLQGLWRSLKQKAGPNWDHSGRVRDSEPGWDANVLSVPGSRFPAPGS